MNISEVISDRPNEGGDALTKYKIELYYIIRTLQCNALLIS